MLVAAVGTRLLSNLLLHIKSTFRIGYLITFTVKADERILNCFISVFIVVLVFLVNSHHGLCE